MLWKIYSFYCRFNYILFVSQITIDVTTAVLVMKFAVAVII